MTNTLHRFGPASSFHDDFVIFAIPSKGRNEAGSLAKLKTFLELALKHQPVNLGDALNGGALRPATLTPLAHWSRAQQPDFRAVIDGLTKPTTVAAVFDKRANAEAFVDAVHKAELGMSVNISTSIEGAEQCCHAAGIARHSVGYSLGFEGKTEKLPEDRVMMLSTMCGHGMIAHSLARKMTDWVKEGRRTPEEAAAVLMRFCSCGVFNPTRAARILKGEPSELES